MTDETLAKRRREARAMCFALRAMPDKSEAKRRVMLSFGHGWLDAEAVEELFFAWSLETA